MQDQAFPVGRRLLKLGLGVSGVLSAICPSALASPPEGIPEPEPKRTLPESIEPGLDVATPPSKAHPQRQKSLHDRSVDEQNPGQKPALEVDLNKVAQPEPVQPAPLVDALMETRSRDRRLQQHTDNQLDQLCYSLQRCEQSITLNVDATGATVSDVFEVAPNVRVQNEQLPNVQPQNIQAQAPLDLSGDLAQVQEDEPSEERDEDEQPDDLQESDVEASPEEPRGKVDDELGIIRTNPIRSDVDLGILRLLQTATAKPKEPKPPFAFLIGRLGYLSSDNTFRSNGFDPNDFLPEGVSFNGSRLNRRDNAQIYQSGLSLYLFPRLSEKTNLYVTAETNLARYEGDDLITNISLDGDTIRTERTPPDYNELEFQLGIRHKIMPRTYAQIGWRNQSLYKFGYEDRFFSANYIDALVSHRSILNSRTWLDSIYQARLGFADPKRSSRFRQTFTLSLNYGFSKDFRTSLLYQLDFEDYTQISRFDTYQQVLGVISYGVTPEAKLSLFGGTRFGRSSESRVNLDDTFYGAGLNVNLPLF